MIDFTENEDGTITYDSKAGRVRGLQVGTCAVRCEALGRRLLLTCQHCRRCIAYDDAYAVDDLKSGEQMVPFRSRASAVVFADSLSLEGYERGLTVELMAWLCDGDLREAETGEALPTLRQWRRDREESKAS